MTTDFDFDDNPIDEGDAEVELDDAEEPAAQRRPNRLRMLLLVLLILVLLCAVCFMASRYISIPGLSPQPAPPTQPEATAVGQMAAPVEAQDTTEPTQEPGVPPTEETAPTDEASLPEVPVEEPVGEATEEPVGEATEEPVGEATEEPVGQPTEEPVAEPTEEAPTAPVACDANTPPVANAGGPYEAMMGKGQAVVNFDGSASSDADGNLEGYVWDFGDGSEPGTGQTVTYGYAATGAFTATLTVIDNCGASTQAVAAVTIVNAAPPTDGTPAPPDDNGPPPAPGGETLGFCHLVQYGQTMSGLAWYYNVPLQDLALVNAVSPEYFVVAGQGLFIPMAPPQGGPNLYEVLPGETLGDVAYQCGLTPAILASANNLDSADVLVPGQTLVIPPWRQVYP